MILDIFHTLLHCCLNYSKMRTEDITIDFLQSMRMKTDPVADKVISEIIASNTFELNDLNNHLRTNREITDNQLPEVAQNYFKEKIQCLTIGMA